MFKGLIHSHTYSKPWRMIYKTLVYSALKATQCLGLSPGCCWKLWSSCCRHKPAVDDHGSGTVNFCLLVVDLVEEAEDAARLLGDTVVGPAQVLVVPNGATLVWLYREREGRRRNCRSAAIKKKSPNEHNERLVFGAHHFQRSNLQNSDFVISRFPLWPAGHQVLTHLLGGLRLWPVRHTFILCQKEE